MGSEPEWNETFLFSVSEGVEELLIKLMDSDAGTDDDLVGEIRYVLIYYSLSYSTSLTAEVVSLSTDQFSMKNAGLLPITVFEMMQTRLNFEIEFDFDILCAACLLNRCLQKEVSQLQPIVWSRTKNTRES